MASGDENIYQMISPVIEKISALDGNGKPCSSYLGNDGAGHFVKTIHNGIEYAEMKLLTEVFTILKLKMQKNLLLKVTR